MASSAKKQKMAGPASKGNMASITAKELALKPT